MTPTFTPFPHLNLSFYFKPAVRLEQTHNIHLFLLENPLLNKLTGNVGLSCEDGVLELIGHNGKLIIRCPVDADGIVRRRAQLFPYGWSTRSCEE